MQHHIDNKAFHIEILAPKQNSEKLDEDLEKFGDRYRRVLEAGYVACVTDNPMGHLSFQATEVISELGLPVEPEQLMVHLNTFHVKPAMDDILKSAAQLGVKYLLVVSGDGGERLPRLSPESLGLTGKAVTAVELLQYIHGAYPGVFHCGVAFNPYEPQDHELHKMERKIEAGAKFICTQPIIGRDERLYGLQRFKVPIIVDAWMSKKIHLLSECVGYEIPQDTPYDPVANLKALQEHYPGWGLYLALLSFKTQFPFLREWWT